MSDVISDPSTKEEDSTSVAARVMTSAIQKLLKYDPASVKKLKPLAGKKIRINIQPFDQSMVLVIHADSISVHTNQSTEVDTTISGKPTSLFAMSNNQHIPGLDGVTINGDATIGQFVADLLKNLSPDWEEAWCDLLGEGPGYHVSQFIEGLKKGGLGIIKSIQTSSKDFLLEENRELVKQHEMESFLDEVDDIKSDVVQLERKIEQFLHNR